MPAQLGVLGRSCAKHTSLPASFTNGFAVGAGLAYGALASDLRSQTTTTAPWPGTFGH